MGEGEGGIIWENGIETCILSYVKRIASPGSMHETGSLGLVHWDDPEGWDGEGGGRGFRMGNTCTPMAYPCQCIAKSLQYCKVISLQLNKFILRKCKNKKIKFLLSLVGRTLKKKKRVTWRNRQVWPWSKMKQGKG